MEERSLAAWTDEERDISTLSVEKKLIAAQSVPEKLWIEWIHEHRDSEIDQQNEDAIFF